MSIVAVITDPAVGGTFLTWSLHYLAGHEYHYNSKIQQWDQLTDNPISGLNAHGFAANQCGDYSMVSQCLDQLSNINTDQFHSIYFHNLGNTVDVTKPYSQETQQAVQKTMLIADKAVILSNQQKNNLCLISYNNRILTHKLTNPEIKNNSFDEQHNDFIEYFYKNSADTWKQLGLVEIWDKREFLALNIRPYNMLSIMPYIPRNQNHFELDCLELYTMFDATVSHLFDYLGVEINEDRRNSWLPIYNKWKKIHQSKLNFLWHFDKIIDCVIQGHWLDLTRFNLDLLQEACIQHQLIYQHNLNLKTWQLNKFNNTQQLHQLLETNQHLLNTGTGQHSPSTL